MASAARALVTIALVSTAGGCADGSSAIAPGTLGASVEVAGQGLVFDLAVGLGEERTLDARQRELAAEATGALHVPLLEAGAPKLAANGVPIRATCGATLIAPSYAVTAAHCLNQADSDLAALTLELYRPTPALAEGFTRATAIVGTFPDYSHERLGPADGYFVDRYPCTLAARCGDAYGPAVACDPVVAAAADVALVRCDGRPGDAAGFVAVAAADDLDAEVFMPWKHEVYALPADPASELWLHYAVLPGEVAANYHYFGGDSVAGEANQLLPLLPPRSGPAPVKLGASATSMRTDLLGCHGTSGSGALQRGAGGRWELLGPAIHGNDELQFYLCNHVPSLAAPHGPGLPGVAYGLHAATQAMLLGLHDDTTADCDAVDAGAATLFTHLPCLRDSLAASPSNAGLASRLAAPSAPRAFDALDDAVIVLEPGETTALTGFRSEAGQRYRVGAAVWSSAACSAAGCPSVTFRVAGVDVGSAELTGPAGSWSSAAFPVPTLPAGEVTLELEAGAAAALELGALAFVPEALTLEFDSWRDRSGVTLLEANAPDAPMPARFTGDGRAGRALRLLPGEIAVFPRLALTPSQQWALAFAVDGGSTPEGLGLDAGLVDGGGRELVRADATSGAVTLVAAPADTALPAALFIANVGTAPAVLDDLAFTSASVVDANGDGIPDALTTCGACCPLGKAPTRGTAGDDALFAAEAACISAGSGADLLGGSPASDWLWGGDGDDYLAGRGGDDLLFGGDGDDVLVAGAGRVRIDAGAGADTVLATHAAAVEVSGGTGADRILTGAGADTVWPGAETLFVDVGAGDDTVVLFAPCELHAGLTLRGGAGTDSLRVPVAAAELAELGVVVEGFETVVVDGSEAARADCGGG